MAFRDVLVSSLLNAAEREWLPDPVIRAGIRTLLRSRLEVTSGDPELVAEEKHEFLQSMMSGAIAEAAKEANLQHYEVPSDFFLLMLGPALKYSSCYWEPGCTTLAEAESESLRRTCVNAELDDGQRILELGCGWGSLSLWMASHYPQSKITSVSNSSSQREFILAEAQQRGISNLEVITADINNFQPAETFDRVVSVEMFEHVRHHRALLERISRWLEPEGKLLVHIFVSSAAPYPFDDNGPDDWMARNFFSGGVMPSDDLLLRYQEHLTVERQWSWSGVHYQKTLEAWLKLLDQDRERAELALKSAGEMSPGRAVQKWRMFLMACSELFGFNRGHQWWVSHYRFGKR